MWQWVHRSGSPKTAYIWIKNTQPWAFVLCFMALAYGLVAGLLYAPADYQQGEVYRVMYIHVPAAIWSLGVYVGMSIAALMFLVWKLKVADVVVTCAARLGALFTVLTLITGSIWGKPTWGTWWIWDARLTSELLLLFIYMGIIAIRAAIPDKLQASKAASIVTLIGLVNIPIIHYSVYWWNTLHQGDSLSLFGKSTIAPSMLHPLLAMIAAFFFYSVWIMCIQVRGELLKRDAQSKWVLALKLKEA